jgi:hypothetical protein
MHQLVTLSKRFALSDGGCRKPSKQDHAGTRQRIQELEIQVSRQHKLRHIGQLGKLGNGFLPD